MPRYIGKRRNDGLRIGETARSVREIIDEHLVKYDAKDENSIFHKHIEETHDSKRQNEQLKIIFDAMNLLNLD